MTPSVLMKVKGHMAYISDPDGLETMGGNCFTLRQIVMTLFVLVGVMFIIGC